MAQRDKQVIIDPEVLSEKQETKKIKFISKPKGFSVIFCLKFMTLVWWEFIKAFANCKLIIIVAVKTV